MKSSRYFVHPGQDPLANYLNQQVARRGKQIEAVGLQPRAR
jgi:hypothetical protein